MENEKKANCWEDNYNHNQDVQMIGRCIRTKKSKPPVSFLNKKKLFEELM